MAEGRARRPLGALLRGSAAAVRWFWESTELRILLLCSTAGLTLWILWGPRLKHAEFYPQFGDLSGWVQGVGALVAIVVALAQSHQVQVLRAEDIRRQEVRARTQVFAWIAFHREAGADGWRVYLNNMTPTPIAAWALHVEDADTGREVVCLDATRNLSILPGFTERPLGLKSAALLRPIVRLDFADAIGDCWRRDAAGGLAPIEEVRGADGVLVRRP